jgi:hypothetical protein
MNSAIGSIPATLYGRGGFFAAGGCSAGSGGRSSFGWASPSSRQTAEIRSATAWLSFVKPPGSSPPIQQQADHTLQQHRTRRIWLAASLAPILLVILLLLLYIRSLPAATSGAS